MIPLAPKTRPKNVKYSRMDLQKAETEEFERKVMRWSKKEPTQKGTRLMPAREIRASDIQTDGSGNVVIMPQLIGRPCFGVPTAFLRHGRRKPNYVVRMKARIENSRCDRCKAREACVALVQERLRFAAAKDPEFKASLTAWSNAGGLEKGGFDAAISTLGERGWRSIYQPLVKFTFTNTNDDAVNEFWRLDSEREAEDQKKRAKRSLKADWKEGNFLHELMDGLNQGATHRAELLSQALQRHPPVKHLIRFPTASINRVCNTWWGREYQRLTGGKDNPSAIAKLLINYRKNDGKSYEVLRQDVRADLARIRKLESNAGYNGGEAIWPKFIHPALI